MHRWSPSFRFDGGEITGTVDRPGLQGRSRPPGSTSDALVPFQLVRTALVGPITGFLTLARIVGRHSQPSVARNGPSTSLGVEPERSRRLDCARPATSWAESDPEPVEGSNRPSAGPRPGRGSLAMTLRVAKYCGIGWGGHHLLRPLCVGWGLFEPAERSLLRML